MIMEDGKRVIKPRRYRCRPAGKPAFYDKKYPGIYNARFDNHEGFWKGVFGYSHGLIVANAFYENVKRHRLEGRDLAEGELEENVILEVKPQSAQDMLVACLWSHWQSPGEPDLLSFAAITDEPPPEVAAAGHDRCIIPFKPEHIDVAQSRSTRSCDTVRDPRRPPSPLLRTSHGGLNRDGSLKGSERPQPGDGRHGCRPLGYAKSFRTRRSACCECSTRGSQRRVGPQNRRKPVRR
jgi:hypothetical protein